MKKFIPHNYQIEAQNELANADAFGLFMFPGAGKTPLILEKIYQHKEPTLIITPLDILYTTWLKEPKKWEFSQSLKYQILHGPNKNENFHKKAGVYFVNPEGIKWLVEKVKSTGRFPWTTLVIDESAKFKNHKSERFKYLTKILKSFKRRYVMAGNPAPNHYLDIWAQLFVLDFGKRLGTSWYGFRSQYFYPTDYKQFNWALRPGAKEEIIKKISDISLFLDPSSELDLPNRVVIDHELELPAKAKKIYREMEDNLFYIMDNKEDKLVVDNATAASIKCWQIANGFIYEKTDEGRITHHVHDELSIAAESIVDSLQGSPVLIAYNFEEDLKRLRGLFPNARFVPSGSTPTEIQAAEKDWNENRIEILVTQISKFSHGLNLQFGIGHQILLYGLTYNYDVYDQLIRRFERQGAKFKDVIIHRLLVKNTVHEAIVATLENKQSMSGDFLNALKEYRDSIKKI
jgi:SNF2 family DNA or RNA helicase